MGIQYLCSTMLPHSVREYFLSNGTVPLHRWCLGFNHRLITHFHTSQESYCCNLLTILALSVGAGTAQSNLPEYNWQEIMSPRGLGDKVANTVTECSFRAKNIRICFVNKGIVSQVQQKIQCGCKENRFAPDSLLLHEHTQ